MRSEFSKTDAKRDKIHIIYLLNKKMSNLLLKCLATWIQWTHSSCLRIYANIARPLCQKSSNNQNKKVKKAQKRTRASKMSLNQKISKWQKSRRQRWSAKNHFKTRRNLLKSTRRLSRWPLITIVGKISVWLHWRSSSKYLFQVWKKSKLFTKSYWIRIMHTLASPCILTWTILKLHWQFSWAACEPL